MPETTQTASAIMSGFADNYLPVILGQNIASSSSRCIIAIMSILQIIFMSEIATLLKSTNIIKKFSDILIIFVLRTFISLPLVIFAVKLSGIKYIIDVYLSFYSARLALFLFVFLFYRLKI